jgi:hypothetical protein
LTATSPPDAARAEAERQLAASADRHREAAALLQETGRPEAGQHVAVKALGRAVHLVSFALKRAAEAGVPFERLVALTGWEPDLVRKGLEQAPPERFVARLAPAGADPRVIAEATTAFEAIRHLHEFVQRVLAETEASSPRAPAELDDLHDRLETAWRSWRESLERPRT